MTAKNKQIHDYKQEIEDLTAQVVALGHRLQQVNDRKNDLERANAYLTAQNTSRADQITFLERRNDRLQSEVEWLKLDKHNLNEHLNEVIDERDALIQRLGAGSMPADLPELSDFEKEVLGVIYTHEQYIVRRESDEFAQDYFSTWPRSQTKKIIAKGWITLDDGPGPYVYRLTDVGRAIFERLVEEAKK